MKRIVTLAAAALTGATLMAEEVNLRTLAVEDGSGNLLVLWDEHTSGWWAGNQYTPFDGSTSVCIDPMRVSDSTWVGYELTTPQVVTRIRFFGKRSGDGEQRLCVCRVEGANQADFSDAVTLLECRDVVPTDWRTTTTGWFDVPARAFTTPKTFKYIRFIQPAGELSETTTYCGNIAEVEFYGMDVESYASYAPTVSQEMNLRLYALHDATNALDIISDKTTPYDTGYEYTKSFDGNLSTFYDPKTVSGVSHYVGYALSVPMCVTRMRYSGRPTGDGAASRLRYCHIEGANQADFSDAVTLHTCADAVPADYDSKRGWIEVKPDPSAGLNTFKYLRLIDPAGNQQCGNISALEFYGMDADSLAAQVLADPQPPTGLVATRGAYPEMPTELRWQLQTGVSDSTLQRAPGANGPWTELAQLSGVNKYTDTTAPVGVLSYYRVVSSFTHDGQSVSLTNETPTVFRRWRLLERDPSDMTHFRSGASLIFNCGCGCWTPTSAYTWPAVTNSLMIAFNNVLYKYSDAYSAAGVQYYYDFADTAPASPRTCIGVDLGEPAHFALLYFYSMRTAANGVVLSGSNNADWKATGNFDILTEPISGAVQGSGILFERESLDTDTTYRYLFCHNPDNNGWNNNVSELQFYGWFESDVAAAAQNVTDIAVTCGTTPSATLSWTPVKYGTYTIERKTGDGAWTTVASNLPASTTVWADTSVTCDGSLYTYRITTVNGANEAYSEDCAIRPYITGNGTGLHAEWWTNFVTTTSGEALALVTTNAAVNFADASVGGETENLFARWSGKLIAPYAGDFTFEAEADGVAYLWVDGIAVLYKGKTVAETALTAGEHDITVLWRQTSGSGSCKLYWGGCVTREVIPSTQFIPVPPREIPGEWVGARSFDASGANALFLGDVKANADGTIDMAQSGRDLSWDSNGYNFLWKPMKGDFTLVAKISCLTPTGDRWYGRKAGLMVRSSLDATANMRAYGIKRTGNDLFVDGRHKTTETGQAVREHDKVAGAPISSFSASTSTSAWVRLCRVGNVFTAQYKIAQSDKWSLEYEYEDTNGEYGETTFVGLTAWGEGDGTYTTVPCYLWRFSDVLLRTSNGMVISIK